jgi:putative membrane protein
MSWLFNASVCFGSASTPQATWTIAPALLGPSLAIALVYGRGMSTIWRRSANGRGLRLRQAMLFAAGWVVLLLALATPLHALSERLFTAHMMEHEIIMLVAAPLIAASAPGPALLWGMPSPLRHGAARCLRARTTRVLLRSASRPAVATLFHGMAIWIWHVPGLFEAALERGFLHYLQHVSFLGTALVFWWAMLPSGGKQNRGAQIGHLFVTSMHTSALGVLLVFSPRLWFPANAGLSELLGLSPLEDQQLAGLIMWVPAGMAYAGFALWMSARWIRSSSWSNGEAADALITR